MALTAPQNLQAAVVSSTEVALTWSPVSGAFSYRVNGGPAVLLTANTFINVTGLSPSTTYDFFIVAEGLGGDPLDSIFSPPSDTVIVTTPAEDPTPDVPVSLAAPGVISAEQTGIDQATITWGAVTDATGYEVRIDGGTAIDVGNVLGYTTTDSLAAGDYDFEVRAYAGPGPDVFSAWSTASTVTIAGLTAPAPSAAVLSSGAIEVTWAAVPPADRYQVRVDNATIFSVGSLLEFIDSGLAPVTTRSYEVRGLIDGTALVGPWSAPIEATTNRSVKIEIVGRLRRLSTFLSDRHITARALNAEFNNMLALLNGGTITVFGPEEPDEPDEPTPDPDADATVSPSALTFATRQLGSASPSQTVTISNAVATPLNIGNVSVSGDFLIASDACSNTTLANGESCTVNVQFNPSAEGLRIGDLLIPTNDPGSPATVALSGTGEDGADDGGGDPPDPDPDPTDRTVLVRTLAVGSATTSFSIPLAATEADDLLVIVAILRNLDAVTPPSGWTSQGGNTVIAGGFTYQIQYFVRKADGGEGATVAFTHTSAKALFFSYVVPAEPAATFPFGRGFGNDFSKAWPTVGVLGLDDIFLSTVGGQPGFLMNLVVLGDQTFSSVSPGTITSHNFPDMSVPTRVEMPGFTAVANFANNIPLSHGAGAGTLTFSNASYDSLTVVETRGYQTL